MDTMFRDYYNWFDNRANLIVKAARGRLDLDFGLEQSYSIAQMIVKMNNTTRLVADFHSDYLTINYTFVDAWHRTWYLTYQYWPNQKIKVYIARGYKTTAWAAIEVPDIETACSWTRAAMFKMIPATKKGRVICWNTDLGMNGV